MRKHIYQERHKFEKFLTQTGLKLTNRRKTVFDEVMGAHGHFSAEKLAKKCSEAKSPASRATVYRILNELLQAGVIRETAYGEKHQNFEHVYDERPHHHARCIKCGTMLELSDQGEEAPYQKELNQKQFHILGHELTFYGICKECQP